MTKLYGLAFETTGKKKEKKKIQPTGMTDTEFEMGAFDEEVSPKGWGGTTRAMKRSNVGKGKGGTYKLAWHMSKKGATPHYKGSAPYGKKAKFKYEGKLSDIYNEVLNEELAEVLSSAVKKLEDIKNEYNVDGNGIIKSFGKFESEMYYVPYYWEQGLDGMADYDEHRIFGFKIDEDDRKLIPEFELNDKWLYLEETDQGFVQAEVTNKSPEQMGFENLETEEDYY